MPLRKHSNLGAATRDARRMRQLRKSMRSGDLRAQVLQRNGVMAGTYSIQQRLDSSNINTLEQQEYSTHGVDFVIPDQVVTPLLHLQNSSSCVSTEQVLSSLPASQTWSSEYDFTVSFEPQKKDTKAIAWTYSKVIDKLYVLKDAPCPINFSANAHLSHDVKIRVMAFYTSPEQVSKVVKRCINHSIKECSKGIAYAEHLVRCESEMAKYHQDASTGHHSVIVPFENPPVGQQYSTYIYKFACFGSCAGGPNRRPLMLIFTLEKDNQVIGLKRLDVKICSSPERDRKFEEAQLVKCDTVYHGNLRRKESSHNLTNLSDTLNFTKFIAYPPSKKIKAVPDKDGYYFLYVDNKDCYEFLLQMKKFYEICKLMEGLSPDITKILLNYQKKSGDKSE